MGEEGGRIQGVLSGHFRIMISLLYKRESSSHMSTLFHILNIHICQQMIETVFAKFLFYGGAASLTLTMLA